MNTVKTSLYFPPDTVHKPFITHLVKDYDLTVNILEANIVPGERGKTVLDLTGEDSQLEAALTFLSELGVRVHIFSTNIIHIRSKCMDCGACVAVCQTGALSIGAPEWTLAFDNGKCVRCKHCVDACPTRAIDVRVFE